jgi:ABC-type proline/glycine betaine transport system ATPase subunit
MMPLTDLLKNKLLIAKNYPGFTESDMNLWPFWQLEENIKIINELQDEENKTSEKQKDSQKNDMPNMNPSNYMKGMGNFKSPKF